MPADSNLIATLLKAKNAEIVRLQAEVIQLQEQVDALTLRRNVLIGLIVDNGLISEYERIIDEKMENMQ